LQRQIVPELQASCPAEVSQPSRSSSAMWSRHVSVALGHHVVPDEDRANQGLEPSSHSHAVDLLRASCRSAESSRRGPVLESRSVDKVRSHEPLAGCSNRDDVDEPQQANMAMADHLGVSAGSSIE
jgi:hypothetical protein